MISHIAYLKENIIICTINVCLPLDYILMQPSWADSSFVESSGDLDLAFLLPIIATLGFFLMVCVVVRMMCSAGVGCLHATMLTSRCEMFPVL